jgi:hypothetical protein
MRAVPRLRGWNLPALRRYGNGSGDKARRQRWLKRSVTLTFTRRASNLPGTVAPSVRVFGTIHGSSTRTLPHGTCRRTAFAKELR